MPECIRLVARDAINDLFTWVLLLLRDNGKAAVDPDTLLSLVSRLPGEAAPAAPAPDTLLTPTEFSLISIMERDAVSKAKQNLGPLTLEKARSIRKQKDGRKRRDTP